MICFRLTPRFHVHWHVPAKRRGFVKTRAHFRRLNDWGWLGARITLWWSNVDRSRHWNL